MFIALLLIGFSVFFKKSDSDLGLNFENKKTLFFPAVFVLMYGISVFFSIDSLNSLMYFFRMFEFFVVYIFVVGGFLDLKKVFTVFIVSMSFQSLIAISQYLQQGSLDMKFLGEPVVSPDIQNVAKVDLGGEKILRSYGTFPHPNILGAYLTTALISLMYLQKIVDQKWKKFFYVSWFLLVFALGLTFSRTAVFAFVLSAFIMSTYYIDYKKLKWFFILIFAVLLLFFITGISPVLLERISSLDINSVKERLMYLDVGKRVFLSNPFGIGAGNFTSAMQNYYDFKLVPWLFQPVHNIFVLLLDEIGIQGLISFIIVFGVIFYGRRKWVLALSLMISVFIFGSFDHYLISLYQGQALLWMIFSISNSRL